MVARPKAISPPSLVCRHRSIASSSSTRRNKAATHTAPTTATMRILVGVKRVIDYAVKVRVAADKKGMYLCGQVACGVE